MSEPGDYHFFVEINGGEWHRTNQGDQCDCGIHIDDKRVLKLRGHDDDSWDFAPSTHVGKCFPEHMRNPPRPPLDDATKATVLDGYAEAADKMLQLAAENQQLKQRVSEYELLFGHALSTDEFLQQLLTGLGGQLPDGTPRTVEGIVSAVADVVLKLDCHEDASTPAFDEIAALCGCPEWEYPGQVIRDVQHVVRERDGLKVELRDVMVVRDHLSAKLQMAERIRDDARAECNAKIESVRFWREQAMQSSNEVLRLSAEADRRRDPGDAVLKMLEDKERQLREWCDLAEGRRDDLLKLVAKLSNEVPFPDEWKNWESQRASLVAEVGTLKARVRELEIAHEVAVTKVRTLEDVAKGVHDETLRRNEMALRRYKEMEANWEREGNRADELVVKVAELENTNRLLQLREDAEIDVEINRLSARVRELVEQKDGAYRERDMCVAGLAALAVRLGWSAWRGKHVGEPWDHDWRNIIFINLPSGQVSWHIHDSELEMFAFLPEILEREWDGHTTAQKYERVVFLTVGAAPYDVPAKPGCPDCGTNLDGAIRRAVELSLQPDQPSNIAYTRVRADFPDGGEEARDAFWRYLREENAKQKPWAQPGLPSAQVRDRIIEEVGMMAANRTPEMQAAYNAAVARETVEAIRSADPDMPVQLTLSCGCSEKYKELRPGIHAKYCPLKGLPLEAA